MKEGKEGHKRAGGGNETTKGGRKETRKEEGRKGGKE